MRLSVRAALLVTVLTLLPACSGSEEPPAVVGRGSPGDAPATSSPETPEAGRVALPELVPPPPGEGWISDSGGPVLVTEANAAEAYELTAEEAVAQLREERARGVVDAATQQWTREAPVSLTRTTVRRYDAAVYEYPVAPVAVPLDAPPVPDGLTAACHLLPAAALDDRTFAGSCSVTWAAERINAVVVVLGTDEAAVRSAASEHTQAFLDTVPV